MTTDIKVPSMGESVSEATISKWFKKPGDAVKQDEAIAELETDKVTLEVNAPAAGVLASIASPEGSTVVVGAVIGTISEGAAASAPAESRVASRDSREDAPPARLESHDSSHAAPSGAQNPPSVRKMLDENPGVNAATIPATGKDGRLTKGDVAGAIAQGAGVSSQVSAKPPATDTRHLTPDTSRREERVKMTKLRQVIAKRLKDSQNTAAILTTFNEVDMTNVMALRNEYKDVFEKKHGIRLGFMGFFIKAAVNALKQIPEVNAQIDGDEIIYKNYYDIGVAVGTEQGLVVPVVRNADQLSIPEIEAEISRLAKKARDGQLSMSEMSGGTFTVTNGGVYGSLMATPIINPPQSGILGMHKVQERPVAVNGQVVIRPMMYIALSYDHRIIDGRESVTFLVKVKEAVEDPRRLLLGL